MTQNAEGVVNVMAERIEPLSLDMGSLGVRIRPSARNFR
jgi:hypothetical protein